MIIYATIDTERHTISAEIGDWREDFWTEFYDVNFNTMTVGTLIEDIEEDFNKPSEEDMEEEDEEE